MSSAAIAKAAAAYDTAQRNLESAQVEINSLVEHLQECRRVRDKALIELNRVQYEEARKTQ